MNTLYKHTLQLAILASLAGPVLAQAEHAAAPRKDTTSSADKQAASASRHVNDAVAVVHKLEMEDSMRPLIAAAKGVFVIPSYGRAAAGIGADGGTGILLARRADGSWAEPVFYTTGGLSVGLQAGAQGGTVAFVLNNQKAIDVFLKKTSVSLNASAGLTVLNWNKMVEKTAGAGDVVAWSDTKGLFGDVATVEVSGIRFNQKLNNAYYHRTLSATDVIEGKASNPQSQLLVRTITAAAANP